MIFCAYSQVKVDAIVLSLVAVLRPEGIVFKERSTDRRTHDEQRQTQCYGQLFDVNVIKYYLPTRNARGEERKRAEIILNELKERDC